VALESIEGVEVTSRDHLLTIRLARPERRNAMTPDQMNYVGTLCREAEDDNDVRVVLLTGTGDAFCAGADLSGVDLSADGGQIPPVSMGRNLFLPMLELTKPLIGGINGVAAGGGLGLALCCDIRLGSEDARFATAFSRIALTANDAVGWLLPRIVGIAKAIELISIAKPIDATESERIGLLSYVYRREEFAEKVGEFVDAMLAGPPVGLRFSKRLVLDGLNRTYREHVLAQEYASLANRTIANHDIQEGVAAFKEKRTPEFQGNLMQSRWDNY
jgi:2-(1,2-epoxy-1,2-dihydrophenyl)acetyl-CoA isomerase